ncbi:MAG: thioredoxin family protein [Chloroflexota bacterium]|nr:thioredoxin family protein [Chloroflexota bacterium]
MALTPERREKALKEGQTFEEFVNSAKVNREFFLANYQAYELSTDDLAFFASLEEPIEVLALVEDWCGDVVANTPLFALIEKVTGKLNLHLLPRDPDNQDIAVAYPHTDGRNHIPTYLFYNQAGEELGVLIERPEVITTHLQGWFKAFFDNHPELEGRGKPLGELSSEVKTSLLSYIREQRAQVVHLEQTAILETIQQIVRRPAFVAR